MMSRHLGQHVMEKVDCRHAMLKLGILLHRMRLCDTLVEGKLALLRARCRRASSTID